jgi:hypothetical protein
MEQVLRFYNFLFKYTLMFFFFFHFLDIENFEEV